MCWFYGNNTFPFTQGDYDQTSLKSCYTLHGPGLQICSSHRIWLVIVVKTTQIRTLLTQVSCSAAPLLLTVPNMLFVSLAATTTLAQDGKSCHTLHHLESGVQLFREKKLSPRKRRCDFTFFLECLLSNFGPYTLKPAI